jgi:tetratricopeptide (TPR) repeat protein
MRLLRSVFLIFFGSLALFSCEQSSRDRFNMPLKDKFNLAEEQKATITYLSDAILSNPSDPINYFKRAKAFLQASNLKEALVDISRAERFEPNNGEFLFLKAKIQFAQKDKNALLNAKRSEDLGFQDMQLYILLSELNLAYGTTKEASKYIKKAEEFYPYSSDLQISKGNLSMKIGDTATALAYFKRSLLFGEHKLKPYENLINSYLNLSILDSALRYTGLALKRFPEAQELSLIRGNIYEKAGVSDSAIAVYKRILKSDPERNDLLEKIGNIYFRNRNFSSAFLIFDQLYKKLNENSKYLYKAADCYEAKGQYKEALDYLADKGEDYEEENDFINRSNRLTNKIDNGFVETPFVFTKPPTTVVTKPKKVKQAIPEPEPERRIFNSSIGTIEKIQKRSSIGIQRDSTRN